MVTVTSSRPSGGLFLHTRGGGHMIHEIDGSPLDPSAWGAKASALAKLVALYLPVPPAICFRPGALNGQGGDRILRLWLASHPAPLYVLRSSSLIEDLATTAGAGISTTLVSLSGEPAYLLARARDEFEQSLRGGGSLILQVQADCLYAGVAFVDNGTVSIEASDRSVTAITSGEPPQLTASVTSAELSIHMTRRQTCQPVLEVLRQVAGCALKAATIFAGCADVEWVHSGVTCQLVQARPLTRKLEP
jgi:hypothetical protein